MADSPTAKELFEALRVRTTTVRNGITPGILMPEVTMHTPEGFDARADAVLVGFTQAQGRMMEGFEIKVSRADWLSELNHPEKSEPWVRNCHRFWLVAPKGVVKDGELPENWGLLTPTPSGSLRAAVRAKAMTHTPSWEASQAFISRCSSAGSSIERFRLQAKEAAAAKDRAVAHAAEIAEQHRECGKESELLSEVRRFEEETGIALAMWGTRLASPLERFRQSPRLSIEDLFSALLAFDPKAR